MLELIEFTVCGLMRLVAGPLDRRRITDEFDQRGDRVRDIRWAPLTTGWISNWYDRFYEIDYDDASGSSRTVSCRTSWRTGVEIMSDDGAD